MAGDLIPALIPESAALGIGLQLPRAVGRKCGCVRDEQDRAVDAALRPGGRLVKGPHRPGLYIVSLPEQKTADRIGRLPVEARQVIDDDPDAVLRRGGTMQQFRHDSLP
jgi:hypothetical protein